MVSVTVHPTSRWLRATTLDESSMILPAARAATLCLASGFEPSQNLTADTDITQAADDEHACVKWSRPSVKDYSTPGSKHPRSETGGHGPAGGSAITRMARYCNNNGYAGNVSAGKIIGASLTIVTYGDTSKDC